MAILFSSLTKKNVFKLVQIPLVQEFGHESAHILASAVGFSFGGLGVHQAFQFKELLIKVIDGRFRMASVLVMADQFSRLDRRIVDLVIMLAAIDKGPGNPNRAQGLDPVGILDVLPFQGQLVAVLNVL